MGDQLGGRPEADDCLDDQGHALYHRMAESPAFLAGIARLERGVREYRVAIMCSEEDPAVCHRYLLVTRVIRDRCSPWPSARTGARWRRAGARAGSFFGTSRPRRAARPRRRGG